MLLERLGLSVWLTDSERETLPEYEVKQTDDETMECWIPSTEGANFRIRWSAPKDSRPGLDLMCYPYLDGIGLDGYQLKQDGIADGKFGEMYYHAASSSSAQLYQFGRRELTDGDDGAPLDSFEQGRLNTIRAELVWGRAENTRELCDDEYLQPPKRGPINEMQAKKGHSGSAELGSVFELDEPDVTFDFITELDTWPSIFIFHYAPREWLLAQGIMPRLKSPGSTPLAGQKRPRGATPEVIDIDDIETDDDEIVIIRHLVPMPIAPKQKRHKLRVGVKKEEEGLPEFVAEESNGEDVEHSKET